MISTLLFGDKMVYCFDESERADSLPKQIMNDPGAGQIAGYEEVGPQQQRLHITFRVIGVGHNNGLNDGTQRAPGRQ